MYRFFLIAFLVLGFMAVYISCSDESTPSGDTGITDTEIKDAVIERDASEIKDREETKDEIGDAGTDEVTIIEEDFTDTGVEDVKDVIEDIGTDEGVTDLSDTNPTPPAKILPGLGIDILYDGKPRQIRIDDTYGVLKDIKTSVPDSRVPYYLRVDELHFDMLFVDTDGSKSLSDQDKLVRIILSRDFNGETEGKTRAGDPLSKAKAEFGQSDHSATTNVNGTDYTFDFYFKKGINVGSDKSQIITGFTIYRPQKVVPSGDIDYENSEVLGITADIAMFMSNATSISDMRNILGPEDLMVENNENGLIYYNYLSIGFTAIDSQSSSGDVKTIALYAPYFGKLKNTTLTLGSSKADIDAYFSKKYGAAKTMQQDDITIYYYVIKTKDLGFAKYNICLGFIYNQNDDVASIMVGLPIKQ
jgi:hypothetical protein